MTCEIPSLIMLAVFLVLALAIENAPFSVRQMPRSRLFFGDTSPYRAITKMTWSIWLRVEVGAPRDRNYTPLAGRSPPPRQS